MVWAVDIDFPLMKFHSDVSMRIGWLCGDWASCQVAGLKVLHWQRAQFPGRSLHRAKDESSGGEERCGGEIP